MKTKTLASLIIAATLTSANADQAYHRKRIEEMFRKEAAQARGEVYSGGRLNKAIGLFIPSLVFGGLLVLLDLRRRKKDDNNEQK